MMVGGIFDDFVATKERDGTKHWRWTRYVYYHVRSNRTIAVSCSLLPNPLEIQQCNNETLLVLYLQSIVSTGGPTLISTASSTNSNQQARKTSLLYTIRRYHWFFVSIDEWDSISLYFTSLSDPPFSLLSRWLVGLEKRKGKKRPTRYTSYSTTKSKTKDSVRNYCTVIIVSMDGLRLGGSFLVNNKNNNNTVDRGCSCSCSCSTTNEANVRMK